MIPLGLGPPELVKHSNSSPFATSPALPYMPSVSVSGPQPLPSSHDTLEETTDSAEHDLPITQADAFKRTAWGLVCNAGATWGRLGSARGASAGLGG